MHSAGDLGAHSTVHFHKKYEAQGLITDTLQITMWSPLSLEFG